jgi:hypothetical protein
MTPHTRYAARTLLLLGRAFGAQGTLPALLACDSKLLLELRDQRRRDGPRPVRVPERTARAVLAARHIGLRRRSGRAACDTRCNV